MQIQGERRIAAPRQRVWEALNDPAVLRACIPGCEELKRVSETQFEGRVTAKVGPVKATFGGIATLSNVTPPEGYTLTGEGKGAAGFAKGTAIVRLNEDAGVTVLSYEASAQVGGRLAQVGGRLIEGTTRKLSDAFFDRFAEQIGAPPVAEPTAPAPQAPPPTVTAAPEPRTAVRPTPPPPTAPAPEAETTPAPPGATPVPPAGVAVPPVSPRPEDTAGAPPPQDGQAASKGLSPAVWIVGLGGIVLLVLWALGSFG